VIGNPFVSTTIGLVACILTLWMSVPQSMRIWRDRSCQGVSPLTWMLFCLTFSQWVGYGLREHIWVAFGGNVLALLTASTILVGVHRARPKPTDALVGVLMVLGSAAALLIGHNAPTGVVIVVQFAAFGVRLPQVYASFRTWCSLRPSEVSLTSWWISLASGVAWLLYGLTLPDRVIAIVSPTIILASTLVLILEFLAIAGRARATRNH